MLEAEKSVRKGNMPLSEHHEPGSIVILPKFGYNILFTRKGFEKGQISFKERIMFEEF